MGRFLVKRLAEMVPVVIGITIFAFLLIHLVPGDPVLQVLGPRATPANVANMRAELGIDRSLPAQYWHFISDAVTLSFGQSIRYRSSVGSVIGGRLAPTFLLISYGLLVSVLVAFPLAFVAALRRNRLADAAIRLGMTFTFAMPSFWLGLL